MAWTRRRASLVAACGPLLLFALFFFFIKIPRIREAVVAGLPYFLGMGLLTMGLVAWAARRRGGIAAKGAMGAIFVGACAVLLTFSIFEFVTARHTAFREGELLALVEVQRDEWPTHEIENDAVIVRYKDESTPIPAMRIELHYFEEGEPAPPFETMLPGEKWGIGGELMVVKNWYFFFGDRTFCRLTGIDAKFEDLKIASVGENLPGFDPDSDPRPLDEEVPLLNRKLREICRVERSPMRFDQFVYQSIDAGRHFGIYLKPGGGLQPKALSAEEFDALLERRFVRSYADIL